jgi:16S rRNA (uracil1498-N3)-methyltransferase
LTLMNLILLFEADFAGPDLVRLTGRRAAHVIKVHRAAAGDSLSVGVAGGRVGRGRVTGIEEDRVEMRVELDSDPPKPLDVTLVLAVPRPKVLNRAIASIASLGIKRVYLINAWRVEKSYWKSPRLTAENLEAQAIAGLEQARDTILPRIELRRFFRKFVEEELPSLSAGTVALAAHPYANEPAPRHVRGPLTLAIGPEGGFIEEEIDSLERAGFVPVTLGARVLRVETAVAALVGRLT